MDYDQLAISHEVFAWPEFIAFAKRLGIRLELATQGLSIDLDIHKCPVIVHKFLGSDVVLTATADLRNEDRGGKPYSKS